MHRFLFFYNTKSEYINHIYQLVNGIYYETKINNDVISFINGDIDILDVLESYLSDSMENINVIVSDLYDNYNDDYKKILIEHAINMNKAILTEKEILRKNNIKLDVVRKHVLKNYYDNTEFSDIILALANSNLNVSKASEQLFMHRNTLMNKLDRFYNDTNYDLKNFNDFVIIYNLL